LIGFIYFRKRLLEGEFKPPISDSLNHKYRRYRFAPPLV
jgi:hypothetical protein